MSESVQAFWTVGWRRSWNDFTTPGRSCCLISGRWTDLPAAFQLWTVFGRIPLLQPELFLLCGWAFICKRNQTRPKSAKKRIYKTQQKLTSPAASVPGCFFLVFSSLQMIDLFIISTWGNAIHHQPSVYRHEPIDFFVCMYYIKITVNDWEIYRTFILLHFVYT